MKHYTATIPLPLAEKLKEKGMPKDCGCNLCCYPPYNVEEEYTYGFVFDWLMEKDIRVYPVKIKDSSLKSLHGDKWHGMINSDGLMFCPTWHEAANAAIEKALTLI